MTIYANGVVPAIVAPATVPSSVLDSLMALRGTIKTRIGTRPNYGTDAKPQAAVELVFGDTGRAITARAKALLPALDGDEATYVIYFDEDGAAVVWNHEYAAMVGVRYFSDSYFSASSLTVPSGTTYVGRISISEYAEVLRMEEEARLQREEEEKQARIARIWAARFDVITDAEVKAAVKDFYEEFYDPEKIIRWWAGLYDPDIGGFYYANSARDAEGYLPDMESTYQIVQRFRQFDSDLARFLGPEITAKMIKFYQDRQDPDDGYFYHPQWTKAQSQKNVMRYTRDQDWAITVLGWLHSAPLYKTAIDRAKEESGAGVLTVQKLAAPTAGVAVKSADWKPNVESVTKYVNNLLDTKSCESWSNTLQTQATTFKATGMLDTVLDILDQRINPEYGLWVSSYNESKDVYYNLMKFPTSEVPYGIFTCAYKVMILYNSGQRLVPYSDKMVANAIKAINSRDPGARITYIFNPWATLGNLRQNLEDYGTAELLAAYDAQIKENILEMIASLKSSLGKYRWEDGSYSYLQSGSKSTIYDTPVSLGKKEGDVNANNLVMSFAMHISHTIGVDTIPVFNENHGKLMKELLQNAPRIYKGAREIGIETVDFSEDELNALPAGATEVPMEGTTFRVVEEPGKTSNRVLEIKKDTEGNENGGLLTLPLITAPTMTDSTVLEFRVKICVSEKTRFGNSITGTNPNMMQMRLMCGDKAFWMPTLRFNASSNPATGYVFMVGKSTKGGAKEFPDNQSKVFQYGQWYEFTFRLTIKNYGKSNAEFKVEILVDGVPFGTSSCFYSDVDYDQNKVTSGNVEYVENTEIGIRFQPLMRAHTLIYVDDVSCAVLQKTSQ